MKQTIWTKIESCLKNQRQELLTIISDNIKELEVEITELPRETSEDLYFLSDSYMMLSDMFLRKAEIMEEEECFKGETT